MHATQVYAALTSLSSAVLAGGPTWCTFNDDCMGYADKLITKQCCEEVDHSARYDSVFKVCLGMGGHLSNAVDHGAMAECCHAKKANRMCGCKPTALLNSPKNRDATHLEWKTYKLDDRPEPDAVKDPGEMVGSWQIPMGDALVNTLHDKHLREDGKHRRLPKDRKEDNDDYASWCKRP